MARYGITVPFDGIPLHAHRDVFRELVDLGYTDLWSAESGGNDGFTPLTLAAVWAPEARLGVAIVPAYTRGPATLAMCVASLADAAPGRFVFGLGSSSKVIVEDWNATPFDKPYQRTRDTLRFLQKALSGEKVTETYETFEVRNYRLGRRVEKVPPILLGALRSGMLRLAGREADGAILNWLSPSDVKQVVPLVHEAGPGKEIAARIFVCPSSDRDAVRALGRRAIAAYLNVPVYAAFHEWLGRGELLNPMWEKWKAGDRRGASESVPDEVIDQLVINGPPEACKEQIQAYVENGVDTPVLAIFPLGMSPTEAARKLAPK
ncbi:MAG: LLM class F420-dependent oxidoreductase [Myxococcota bacterium]